MLDATVKAGVESAATAVALNAKLLEEAKRSAETASRQADQLAARSASSATEAAQIRAQSLKNSRDEAVKAAGDSLDDVFAVQQAFAPRIAEAVSQEAQATLAARKLANQKWRSEEENSNAYRAYYGSLSKAASDSASAVEAAGQRVANAAAAQAQAVNDARYTLSASLLRYSFGEGSGGLEAALKAYGAVDTSNLDAALSEVQRRSPQIAALIREAYGEEIAQQLHFVEAVNSASADLSQQNIDRIKAGQQQTASYAGTLEQLTGILGEAIGQGNRPPAERLSPVAGRHYLAGRRGGRRLPSISRTTWTSCSAWRGPPIWERSSTGAARPSRTPRTPMPPPPAQTGPSIEQGNADLLEWAGAGRRVRWFGHRAVSQGGGRQPQRHL